MPPSDNRLHGSRTDDTVFQNRYPSHSEADQALCNNLAWWLNRDPVAMDAAFRKSGLFREKWDKKHYGDGRTYGEATIFNAIAATKSTYKQGKETKAIEAAPVVIPNVHSFESIYTRNAQVVPIIKGFWNEEDALIKSADSGLGKSLLAQDIAMSLACGASFLWNRFEIHKPRVSLFIQSENGPVTMKDRVRMKCNGNPNFLVGLQNIYCAGIDDEIQMIGCISSSTFQNQILEAVKKVGEHVDIIIFDPLISYHDGDENDNTAMRASLDLIGAVCRQAKATPLIIHHNNREGNIRGASAIRDWTRGLIKLKKLGNRQIKVDHDKANNMPEAKPFVLQFDEYLNFSAVEMADILSKKTLEQCRMVRKALELQGGKTKSKAQLIIQYREISGVSEPSARRHIDAASENGFIRCAEYIESRISKCQYFVPTTTL